MTDNKLKFSDYIYHAVNKANQILGLIKRSFTYLDIRLLKRLYTLIVMPHLEYSSTCGILVFKLIVGECSIVLPSPLLDNV